MIIERYSAEARAARPGIGAPELHILTSRYVAPPAVAPHMARAAVDVALVDSGGQNSTSAPRSTPLRSSPALQHRPATRTIRTRLAIML